MIDFKKTQDVDYSDKEKYCWTSMIRQPEFVTPEVFEAAKKALARKNPGLDPTRARLELFTEGTCAQVMHIGPYDEEPTTLSLLHTFISASGYQEDISETRRHHEIYLGDPRKTAPEKRKTVLRYPIKSLD
ncbi:MAG: GyrI-like domain-containing protein [Clostridia bacterium]|nr:GyrI-like domain-containing protein [Clostridia bacterium]